MQFFYNCKKAEKILTNAYVMQILSSRALIPKIMWNCDACESEINDRTKRRYISPTIRS